MIGEFIEPALTDYFMRKASRQHRPISGTFELSPICNFNCKMCYVHRKKSELDAMGKKILPPSFWIDLAKKAADNGMLYLLLTGGEPFLYPGFKEVYDAVSKMGFIISINSNGSLITDEWVDYLIKQPPSRLNITLYGGSDETYEKICGVKNGYTMATKAILKLKEAGINVKLNTSQTPTNVCDINKIIDFSDEHELILGSATYMFPPVRRDETSVGHNHRFTPEQMAEVDMHVFKSQWSEAGFNKYVTNIKERKCLIPGMDIPCEGTEGTKLLCRAGTAAFWTTWEGDITPCGMMPVPKVSLLEHDFMDAWNILVDETSKIRLAPECKECECKDICHACAGMAYAENADFTKKPEYLCKYVKKLKSICDEV